MKKIFFILLSLFIATVNADEIFKCQLKSGKTVYQSTPCESAVKQKTIEIQKVDPRKAAEEAAKLKAWEADFAKREAARLEAEKELQAERDRKASVEALKRSAEYQQRQTEILERQNMPSPYLQYPYYPSYQSFPFYPSHIPYPHTITDTQRTERNEIKHGQDRDDDNDRRKFIFKWK
ncbi:MAG: DUF4124 domain-containing protein [Methylobacter sp.]